MGFPLSRDDVERHLKDLGYRNITDDQLNEFIKDLKRLIRFEEKQSRLKSLIQLRKDEAESKKLQQQQQQQKHIQQRKSGHRSVEETSPRSSSSSSSGHFSEFEHEPPLQQRQQREERTKIQHRRRSFSYRSIYNSVNICNTEVFLLRKLTQLMLVSSLAAAHISPFPNPDTF